MQAGALYLCRRCFFLQDEINFYGFSHVLNSGASFIKKDRTISLKMSVRSFLRNAYVGFMKIS